MQDCDAEGKAVRRNELTSYLACYNYQRSSSITTSGMLTLITTNADRERLLRSRYRRAVQMEC